jgi:cysteine desulfurase
MLRRIYLDNSATTPIDPEVLDAMLPYLRDKFGNASSIHFFGQEARAAVDKARHQVAGLINSRPAEIVFTSGGTESNNLAIRGVLDNIPTKPHIVTSAIEQSAVKNVCEDLEKLGYDVTYVPVPEHGIVRVEDVKAAVRDETALISIMTANNEIGTLQPIREIGKLCKDKGVLFHTDAVQAVGKIPLDGEEMGIDLLSLTAHKIFGPKGIGSLYVRK